MSDDPTPTDAQPDGETPEEQPFETWLAAQDEPIRERYTRHTSGLRAALESERAARKDLERQIRQLARQQDEGSAARAELERLSATLGEQSGRAEFYEAAHAAGVTDLRLAYLAARDAGLMDERGRADLAQLKARHPHLFPSPRVPSGHAGSGTAAEPGPRNDMNALIRRASGRG